MSLSSTQAPFWLLSCSFCFTLWDRIMMRRHYSRSKSWMPAEMDTEERILYFSLEMLVLRRARNLKKRSLLFFLILSFCFHSPPIFGGFGGQPVVPGAMDLWKTRDLKHAPCEEYRREFEIDVLRAGDGSSAVSMGWC